MSESIDIRTLDATLDDLVKRLLDARDETGRWQGRLSSSALSTAAAAFALAKVDPEKYRALTDGGLRWLAEHQNTDGGWGDTIRSASNISTTLLCWSAFSIVERSNTFSHTIERAQSWIAAKAGSLEPAALAALLDAKYGRDRSFSAPILTMCALAGRLGEGRQAWQYVQRLPFELAVLPRWLFAAMRLPVVSYALPALIAIGQAGFYHRRPRNPLTRMVRGLARRRTLRVLEAVQPDTGGFLEAAPLTAFVAMSLAGSGEKDSPVVTGAVRFLVDSVRADGSWPIDTNLATWVTTLSINALAAGDKGLDDGQQQKLREYLLATQYKTVHPYTLAAPGGWAWTNLPGAVPDADDTAGALIALCRLGEPDKRTTQAASAGIEWLLDLQNSDGGIPTFCRGWTNLPFDRSAPDITAHALSAFASWLDRLAGPIRKRTEQAMHRAVAYLESAQRPDGSWVPLWFGNEAANGQENPVYGTARVLLGLNQVAGQGAGLIRRGCEYLFSVRNGDGGWGGASGVASSVEETALATDVLAQTALRGYDNDLAVRCRQAAGSGARWLCERMEAPGGIEPTPIGLYFASLWYFEALYPLVFAVSALSRVRRLLDSPRP